MDYLEKLPKVFASGLYIRRTSVDKVESTDGSKRTREVTKTTQKPVSEETREMFKTLMEESLEKRLGRCPIGFFVTYSYHIGKIRGNDLQYKECLALTISENLRDILSELPELEEGEEYAFPADTSISIKAIGFDGEKIETEPRYCSSWVINALAAN